MSSESTIRFLKKRVFSNVSCSRSCSWWKSTRNLNFDALNQNAFSKACTNFLSHIQGTSVLIFFYTGNKVFDFCQFDGLKISHHLNNISPFTGEVDYLFIYLSPIYMYFWMSFGHFPIDVLNWHTFMQGFNSLVASFTIYFRTIFSVVALGLPLTS